jgi:UrcA family protein
MSKLTCAVAVAMAASLGVADAASARRSVTVTGRVYYADLDLSTLVGAQTMLRRIRSSVASLCAGDPSPLLAAGHNARDTRQCRADALRGAVASLGAPLVSAEYDRTANHEMAAVDR